jgi:iron(III) transport system substrate-binding protein
MVLFMVSVLALTACTPAAAPEEEAAPAVVEEAAPAEEAAPVEEAAPALEETNALVIYSPNSDPLLNATVPLFEEKYGIKVEVISAGTGEVFKRLEGEKNNPYADVVYGGAYATFMNNIDLFQQYVSPEDDQLLEAYQNKNGYITVYTLDGSVLLVNKTLIGDIEVEGYKDLLNPELKGKIVSANPTASSSAYAHLTNMLKAIGGDYESQEGWDFVRDLYANTVVIDSSSSVWKGVRDGEYTVGISYEDPSVTLVRDGADVEVVYMEEGVIFLPAGSAIIKGAKNLLNAQRFIDLTISEEVQTAFATQLTNRPVRKGIETADYMVPYEEINVIEEDMDYVNKNKEALQERFKEIYVAVQ